MRFVKKIQIFIWGLCLGAVKPEAPEKAPGNGSSFNQLLGIKGAKQETVRSNLRNFSNVLGLICQFEVFIRINLEFF